MAALKEQQGKMQAGSWGSHHDSLIFNSSFSTGSGGSSFNNSGSFGNSFMNSNVQWVHWIRRFWTRWRQRIWPRRIKRRMR